MHVQRLLKLSEVNRSPVEETNEELQKEKMFQKQTHLLTSAQDQPRPQLSEYSVAVLEMNSLQ